MKWLKSGIFLAVILSLVRALPVPFADESDPLRLPKSSVPVSYDLTLRSNIHLGERAYSGSVKIEIIIKQDTDVITLHNRGLSVTRAKLVDENNNDIAVTLSYEDDKDFMHLHAPRELKIDEELWIEIEFNGFLRVDMGGFYRSTYRAGGGVTK